MKRTIGNSPFFGRNRTVTIACLDRARSLENVDFDRLIRGLQTYLDDVLVPVWRTPATLVKTRKERHGAWTLVFLDDADQGKDLGYHKLMKHGLPVARVFVRRTLDSDEAVSLIASHELAEMLVDPSDNLWCMGPRRHLYAYEVCDPVEHESFDIDRMAMSDFVYPEYFQLAPRAGARLDHLRRITRPFQVLRNGYMVTRVKGRKLTLFGSKAKASAFRREDRRLHRSEFR